VLAAEQRLRDSDDFRRTVRSGRRSGGAALVVHLLVDEGSPTPARVGFVVSKAVGNAVVRNRVKRRLRHVVKDCLAELPASATLVVRALPPAAGLDSEELRAELARCLQRVRRTPAAASARTGAAS
jgi:ribonuclease P protein component